MTHTETTPATLPAHNTRGDDLAAANIREQDPREGDARHHFAYAVALAYDHGYRNGWAHFMAHELLHVEALHEDAIRATRRPTPQLHS